MKRFRKIFKKRFKKPFKKFLKKRGKPVYVNVSRGGITL